MTRSNGSASSEELRRLIEAHARVEAERRAAADRKQADLQAQLVGAERAEAIERARGELLRRAGEEEAEADHLDALAEETAARLSVADAELVDLRRRRGDLAATVLRDAEEAERLAAIDAERAAALVSANVGRRAVGAGLDQAIAAREQQRAAILAGVGTEQEPEPDGQLVFVGDVDPRDRSLDGLRKRAALHRAQAATLRARAKDDPLGEHAEERPAAAPGEPHRGGVLATGRWLGRERPAPGVGASLGFPRGSIGDAAVASRPRR